MSELLLYSCVGSGVSVCTETIFISAHEEEISAELQYLDCLATFVKSFQVKCCSTYRCLKTFFSIFMAMLTWFYHGLNEKDKICSGEATGRQLPIGNGFAGGVHRLLLTDLSLVLCFRVLPTTCIIKVIRLHR